MSRNGPWIPSDDFLADLLRLMQVASLPGLAIATVEEGSVVWTRAVGVTNAETRAPVGDDTMFQVASLSKPAFAYAVLKLADEGLIDLDLPLAQYRRPSYLSDHPYVDLITARDVLRHSTGLPNWRDCPQERLVPAFKPGTGWRYSGEGFFWLQLVVEHVMGKGLDSVMRSRLFGPAKMPLSTFGWDAEQARLSAYGHKGPGDEEGKVDLQSKRETGGRFLDFATEWGKPISTWSSEDVLRALREAQALSVNTAKAPIDYAALPINLFPNAASSLETTVWEYARFMTLMMDRPRRASWEISEASRRAMLTRQMMKKANAISWGLSWGLEEVSSGLLFYHGGNNGGIFKAFAVGEPARRRAIVIFTNGGGGDGVYQRIIRAATGHDLLEFML